jgi:hypothetical protein
VVDHCLLQTPSTSNVGACRWTRLPSVIHWRQSEEAWAITYVHTVIREIGQTTQSNRTKPDCLGVSVDGLTGLSAVTYTTSSPLGLVNW